jgi:hypothetical protein
MSTKFRGQLEDWIDSPETSLANHLTPRNNPEDGKNSGKPWLNPAISLTRSQLDWKTERTEEADSDSAVQGCDLGCDIMCCDGYVPTFRKNLLP